MKDRSIEWLDYYDEVQMQNVVGCGGECTENSPSYDNSLTTSFQIEQEKGLLCIGGLTELEFTKWQFC